MMDEKLQRVVESLHEKTRNGKLKWDDISTLTGGDEYRVRLGDIIIEFRSGQREDLDDTVYLPPTPYCRILVLNTKGLIVDECDLTPSNQNYELLSELHDVIRSGTRKREDTLDQLLQLLAK